MRTWYYIEENEKKGPVGEEDLIALLQSGGVASDTLVWTEGMEEWAKAQTIKALRSDHVDTPITGEQVEWDLTDPLSAVRIGKNYTLGFGVPVDFTVAARLFRLAAMEGNPEACRRLGSLYGRGEGVEKSAEKHIMLIRIAAKWGDVPALLVLGQRYYAAKKWIRALALFDLAVRQGCPVGHIESRALRRTLSAEAVKKADGFSRKYERRIESIKKHIENELFSPRKELKDFLS